MERLWTPWRKEYVRSAHQGTDACLFCQKPREEDEESTYVLARTDRAFAMLNAYPYNPGHLMVAPFRHVGDFEDLEGSELAEGSELLQRAIRALKKGYDPDGFNMGVNLGRVAGAGVPGHLHWHLVPRWDGDTNFMPMVADTKVLPELLSDTYERLRPLI